MAKRKRRAIGAGAWSRATERDAVALQLHPMLKTFLPLFSTARKKTVITCYDAEWMMHENHALFSCIFFGDTKQYLLPVLHCDRILKSKNKKKTRREITGDAMRRSLRRRDLLNPKTIDIEWACALHNTCVSSIKNKHRLQQSNVNAVLV